MKMESRTIVLLVVLVILVGAMTIFLQKPTGFGPDWECKTTGRGGAQVCIKKLDQGGPVPQ